MHQISKQIEKLPKREKFISICVQLRILFVFWKADV